MIARIVYFVLFPGPGVLTRSFDGRTHFVERYLLSRQWDLFGRAVCSLMSKTSISFTWKYCPL
jgi:hypothetical protein